MKAALTPTYPTFGQVNPIKTATDMALTWYDEPEAWAKFTQPASSTDGRCQSFVVIRGMRCSACSLTLESALLGVNGVLAVHVSAASASASVTWDPCVTRPSDWMRAGLAFGYELQPADDAFSVDKDRQQSRLALWRWLIAGFCMMQVMMYAAPVYFTLPGDVSPEIEQLLRWASWVLSLPVLLFSCGPFFSNAMRDLLQRRISMDLPVSIGILVTFAVSTAATFEPQGWWGREVYFDSLTMFVFFLLTGRWLEQRLRARTACALGALMQRLPASVERQILGSEFKPVAVRLLRLSDVIRILPGGVFPVDGVLLQGSTYADEAMLTGESRPVMRDVGDRVLAGSFNLGDPTLVCVAQTGASTRYAQIVALMAQAMSSKPRLAVLADRAARPFLMFVLFAAVGAAAYWWRTDPAMALMAAVSVLVVTCPCALSLATPTAMQTTAGLLASHGVLVRRLQAIEALAGVDTVIFDKTGTLTECARNLLTVHTRVGVTRENALQWAASLAGQSLHPVSRALVTANGHRTALVVTDVKELPGFGLEGLFVEAGPDGEQPTVRWRLGSSRFCGLDLTDTALSRVHLVDSRGWVATFDFEELVRHDAASTVATLQAAGMAIYMMSGDTQATAARIAEQLKIQNVQGDCTPETKLALMRDLQAKGCKVLMVGDGLNDGPALAASNVSVAIGSAIPLAQAQSDFVIPGAQLLMLPAMVQHARRTLRIIKQNLAWAAVYNATCVPLAIGGLLPAWLAGLGMALSSLLVMANATRLSRFKTKP